MQYCTYVTNSQGLHRTKLWCFFFSGFKTIVLYLWSCMLTCNENQYDTPYVRCHVLWTWHHRVCSPVLLDFVYIYIHKYIISYTIHLFYSRKYLKDGCHTIVYQILSPLCLIYIPHFVHCDYLIGNRFLPFQCILFWSRS